MSPYAIAVLFTLASTALYALGYALAGPLPATFGQAFSLNAAGVIGTLGGVTVAGAMLLRQLRNASPKPAIISG